VLALVAFAAVFPHSDIRVGAINASRRHLLKNKVNVHVVESQKVSMMKKGEIPEDINKFIKSWSMNEDHVQIIRKDFKPRDINCFNLVSLLNDCIEQNDSWSYFYNFVNAISKIQHGELYKNAQTSLNRVNVIDKYCEAMHERNEMENLKKKTDPEGKKLKSPLEIQLETNLVQKLKKSLKLFFDDNTALKKAWFGRNDQQYPNLKIALDAIDEIQKVKDEIFLNKIKDVDDSIKNGMSDYLGKPVRIFVDFVAEVNGSGVKVPNGLTQGGNKGEIGRISTIIEEALKEEQWHCWGNLLLNGGYNDESFD